MTSHEISGSRHNSLGNVSPGFFERHRWYFVVHIMCKLHCYSADESRTPRDRLNRKSSTWTVGFTVEEQAVFAAISVFTKSSVTVTVVMSEWVGPGTWRPVSNI